MGVYKEEIHVNYGQEEVRIRKDDCFSAKKWCIREVDACIAKARYMERF